MCGPTSHQKRGPASSMFRWEQSPNFSKSYNTEMDSRGVEEAMRLEYFCRVVAEPIFEEIKEIQKTHDSWVSFKEALRESYGYEGPKGRGLYKLHGWVSSRKTHQSATHAFVEF